MTDTATGWVILLIALALYFIPTIVARHAYHRHLTAIFVLNLFTGWTFVGWVVALVWANMDQPRDDYVLYREIHLRQQDRPYTVIDHQPDPMRRSGL